MKSVFHFLILCLFLSLASGCFVEKSADGKGEMCEIHHRKLYKTIVRIDYGWGCSSKCRLGMGSDNFPNAKRRECGGCVVTKYKFTEIYFCHSCNKARRKYRFAHRNDPAMKVRAMF